MSDVAEAVELARKSARLEALVDAEKVLRDMVLETKWANDARLLKNAAEKIGKLK